MFDINTILGMLHISPMVALVVVSILLAVSEVLPFFPNIEADTNVQLLVNSLKFLKAKLSLKPAVVDSKPVTPATTPQ